MFHPNFSAKWRRYLYIFPLNDGEDLEKLRSHGNCDEQKSGYGECNYGNVQDNDRDEVESGNKPRTFSIHRLNELLQKLEGKLLSYRMFARDTKASRNE